MTIASSFHHSQRTGGPSGRRQARRSSRPWPACAGGAPDCDLGLRRCTWSPRRLAAGRLSAKPQFPASRTARWAAGRQQSQQILETELRQSRLDLRLIPLVRLRRARDRPWQASRASPRAVRQPGQAFARASSRSMTSPTMLLGVEAPAVRPTVTGPGGSQFRDHFFRRPARSTGTPIGRCRISVAETRQAGSAMWKVGDPVRADPRQIAGVAAVVAADRRPPGRAAASSSRRDDRVLALLGGAADRVERAEARRQLGLAVPVDHRLPEHLADLQRLAHQHRRLVGAADRARGARSGSKPGETASPKCARNAGRIAAVADEVAHHVGFVFVADDEVVAARDTASPATPWRASPRGAPCRG